MNQLHDTARIAEFLNLSSRHFCVAAPLRWNASRSQDAAACAADTMTSLLCSRLPARAASAGASSDEVADWFEYVIADLDRAAVALTH